jgi:hypothetical protein
MRFFSFFTNQSKPFIALSLLLGGIVTTASALAEPPPFTPDKIESFNGKSWAGLTLGVTTQDGVKQQFKNGRGDFSTSVEVKQEKDSTVPYRVSALYVNKDKNATLDGICIRYKNDGDGIPLEKLETALGEPGEVRYAERRYEDWKVIAYPKRGILLFVLKDRVNMLLMGYPDRVANTYPMLTETSAGEIENYDDQFRDRERVLVFASTGVSFDLKNITLDNESREKRDIERDLRRASSSRYLRYEPGASTSGSYRISVSARYDRDKDKDGTVTASLSGAGPFGPLSATKSVTFRLYKGDDDARLEDTRYDRAITEAMRDVESDMIRQVERQQPPPVQIVRRADWDKIIDKYRFHSKVSGGSLVD